MRSRSTYVAVVAGVVAAIGAATLAVWASPVDVVGGRDTYNPNKTRFVWSSQDAQTSSDTYKTVPGIGNKGIKHFGPMIATYTVKLEGSRAQFRIEETGFKPRVATFDPSDGTDTFSFTALLHGSDWRCSDPTLQWRSPSGSEVTLSHVSVIAEYKRKGEEPDFACL